MNSRAEITGSYGITYILANDQEEIPFQTVHHWGKTAEAKDNTKFFVDEISPALKPDTPAVNSLFRTQHGQATETPDEKPLRLAAEFQTSL